MGNPLFDMLGGNNVPNFPGMMGNLPQMMQQFNQFRNDFQGDPKAEVEKLLASGKMNQQQLNQLQSMASWFQQIMSK